MQISQSITVVLAVLDLAFALNTPHQLNRRNIPSLVQALNNAANISCDDPNFKEPDRSTPEYRWETSGAGDLLAAASLYWAEHEENQKYPSISAYVASLAGIETNNFHCEDISVDNDCTKYQSTCDSELGPAFNEILTSMSNMHSPQYYKSIVDSALTKASIDASIKAFDLAAEAVEYRKPDNSLETVNLVAEILGVALLPVGGGVMVSSMVRQGVSAAAAKAAQLTGEIGRFWEKAQKGFNVQSAAFGVEMAMMASQIIAKGTNPAEGAMGMLQEVNTFTDLGVQVLENWEQGISKSVVNLFTGNMTDDEEIGPGVSNLATLQHALDGGLWVDGLGTVNAQQGAISQYLAYALPLAEMMNDEVRPTIIMRPYSCDDSNKAKADGLFQGWVQKFPSDVAVSISEAPGVCFFIVDANRQAKFPTCGRGVGCMEHPTLYKLKGINHQSMDHPEDTPGTWGNIRIENYVRSAYLGWKNNGRNNNVPNVDLAAASSESVEEIWNRPLDAPGEWNSFFTICGNDDPNSSINSDKTPDDIDLIYDNLSSAISDIYAVELGEPQPTTIPLRK
ncbi:hypothetical protein K458DRAFT_402872 [Lentithecium fluviatile CBS 122367]|uniref:Uncharacterized protein n=1 Tax=Lentithecium fluviatile CBS 122367 TaxID=1168545 RepID=A0A6G1J871_9PLEO|nr:hypothetical protein K458DRAFT_402872 [Lentithecium fluviatile CBS 122367]